jgi:hypothetical protein
MAFPPGLELGQRLDHFDQDGPGLVEASAERSPLIGGTRYLKTGAVLLV